MRVISRLAEKGRGRSLSWRTEARFKLGCLLRRTRSSGRECSLFAPQKAQLVLVLKLNRRRSALWTD